MLKKMYCIDKRVNDSLSFKCKERRYRLIVNKLFYESRKTRKQLWNTVNRGWPGKKRKKKKTMFKTHKFCRNRLHEKRFMNSGSSVWKAIVKTTRSLRSDHRSNYVYLMFLQLSHGVLKRKSPCIVCCSYCVSRAYKQKVPVQTFSTYFTHFLFLVRQLQRRALLFGKNRRYFATST